MSNKGVLEGGEEEVREKHCLQANSLGKTYPATAKARLESSRSPNPCSLVHSVAKSSGD